MLLYQCSIVPNKAKKPKGKNMFNFLFKCFSIKPIPFENPTSVGGIDLKKMAKVNEEINQYFVIMQQSVNNNDNENYHSEQDYSLYGESNESYNCSYSDSDDGSVSESCDSNSD